jgi:hypothetical protein
MAITTVDGLIAGMIKPQFYSKVQVGVEAAGLWISTFYEPGSPIGAAVAPTPGLNGAALTTYAGQIPWSNPGAGNSYLARFAGTAGISGTLWLLDRLWHNSGYTQTTTTVENTTSPTWPARDNVGGTTGIGLNMALEVSTATTNAGAITNTTMSYTDPVNGSGRTGTIASFPATAVRGAFIPFQLAAGDTGITALASMTKGTSYAAGTMHMVLYRVLACIAVPVAGQAAALDAITGGMVRLYDNTVPFLVWQPTAATASQMATIQMIVSQG